MVDKSKIKVVIQKYNGSACEEVYDWLRDNQLSWRHGVSQQPIAVGRNQNVARFLAEDVPKGFEYLLFLDDDMVPLAETMPILHEDGDLVYCAYPNARGGIDHFGDGTLCCGCLRISSNLLGKLHPPYFRTGHSGDIMQYTGCDCRYLNERAAEMEVKSRMVGLVGHLQKLVLTIAPESRGKMWRMLFRGAKTAAK